MEVKIELVEKLVSEADKILLTGEAERVIIQLLELQKQIEEGINKAKELIEKKALEINPNFKSITSDNLRVSYRQYGAKYRVDESLIDKLPANFYKVSKRYDAIAEEVEKFTEEKGGLPVGINEIERPKSLSFSLKGEKKNDE